MGKPRDDRSKDLFRPALEEIIDMGHALVRLAKRSIGAFSTSASARSARPGQVSRRCPHGWWRG